MSSAEEARRWLVRGHVQGVGFRLFVEREATQLGLRGQVRNTKDGAVDVVAAGSSDALDRLLDRLYKGPPASSVSSVNAMDFDGQASEFGRSFLIVP